MSMLSTRLRFLLHVTTIRPSVGLRDVV